MPSILASLVPRSSSLDSTLPHLVPATNMDVPTEAINVTIATNTCIITALKQGLQQR